MPAPSALAAVTKSACLTVMTEPRMTRVIWVQPRATRAKTTLQIVREVKAFRITRARGEGVQDHQGAEQQRDAEEDVGDPGDDRVDPAAEVAGEHAGDATEDGHTQGDGDADHDRGPGAVDDAGVDAAALEVVTEPVRLEEVAVVRLRQVVQAQVAGARVHRGEQARGDRDDDQQQDQQRGDHEDRLAAQVVPGVGAEAAGLLLLGCRARLGALGRDLPGGLLVGQVRHNGSSGPGPRKAGRRSGRRPGTRAPGRPRSRRPSRPPSG